VITQWLIQAVSWFWEWVCSWLPAPEVPAWLASAGPTIQGFVSKIGGLGAFLPFSVLGAVLGLLLLLMVASLAIKVVRIIASFFTMGGGSAA
jgi:hypothetical protein